MNLSLTVPEAEDEQGQYPMPCPDCGDDGYIHLTAASIIEPHEQVGDDLVDIVSKGPDGLAIRRNCEPGPSLKGIRGSVIAIGCDCECGCFFVVSFRFHKGRTYVSYEVIAHRAANCEPAMRAELPRT
jgi:hypothetical protein